MANGTIELAPPNEGGDDRNAEVAVVREAELYARAGSFAVESAALTDETIKEFFDEQTATRPQEIEPVSSPIEQATVRGSRAFFVDNSERYGYSGSPILGQVMPGGIRNRAAGVEGRAFRAPWAGPHIEKSIPRFITRVAIQEE